MKLRDLLELLENKDPEMEVVTLDDYGLNFEKELLVKELFVPADDFETRNFPAYRDIDDAVKNRKHPVTVLRIW
jgi:hypothetical protein